MSTAMSNALTLPSYSTFVEAKVASRQPASASPPCVSLPPLPLQLECRVSRTFAYSGKVVRNVMVMSTGDVPTATTTIDSEPETETVTVTETEAETETETAIETETTTATATATTTTVSEPPQTTEETGETPELLKTVQDTWDKVEDKYAVSSLAAAAATLALVASTGVISAIDRLPLVPGVLELVGIGYTGWFAYSNLLFTPERDAFIEKIKSTYKDVTGSN